LGALPRLCLQLRHKTDRARVWVNCGPPSLNRIVVVGLHLALAWAVVFTPPPHLTRVYVAVCVCGVTQGGLRVPIHDRAANLLTVTSALVSAAWEALMGRRGVKRLAALAAMMSTLLHPALFAQPELHGALRTDRGPLVDDGATVEVEVAPVKWLVHRLLTAGDKSARLMRVLALQLCGVFVACPDVAGGYYLPVMLRLCLHGQAVGIGVERDLQEELSVSAVAREHYARLPPPPDASLARVFENSVRRRHRLIPSPCVAPVAALEAASGSPSGRLLRGLSCTFFLSIRQEMFVRVAALQMVSQLQATAESNTLLSNGARGLARALLDAALTAALTDEDLTKVRLAPAVSADRTRLG